MRLRLLAAMFLVASGMSAPVDAACRIGVYGELPLQPVAGRALVAGQVNGAPTVFILDTGAWSSTMSYAEARRLGVKVDPSAFSYLGMEIGMDGIGGTKEAGAATFNMKLGSISLPHELMAAVGMRPLDHDAVALVGLDLLAQNDIELDVPDHVVRLAKVSGCTLDDLDYWNKPYFQTPLEADGSARPEILVNVLVNGHSVPALLDSGAPETIITPEVAESAGASVSYAIQPGTIGGIGDRTVAAGVAHFDSVAVGGETVRNVSLKVAPMWKYNKVEQTGTRLGLETQTAFTPRMLLGYDFLSANRVFIVNSMHTMIFSYMGGPVFTLGSPGPPMRKASASAPP